MRNFDSVNTELQMNALPEGFTGIAGFVYLNPTTQDDVSYDGCPYVDETTASRRYDNPLYSDY